ncbi:MAG: response regulator [Nitrospirota bacterium]|nr:MAG: response regulator [Nitrospirota bacterium]
METTHKNRPSVIVADDNASSAIYMSVVLSRMNLNVLPLPDAQGIVDTASEIHPGMIFLDAGLPDDGAFETLKKIKGEPLTANIPVSVMAPREDHVTHTKLAKLGHDMVLDKPVDPHQLHGMISDNIQTSYKVKRRYLRVATDKKVFLMRNERLRSYNAVSISERGIFIREPSPMDVGSATSVVIPTEGSDRLLLDGKIIYTRDMYGRMFDVGPGMAIEFTDISQKQSIKLRRHIGHLIELGL